MQLDSDTGPTTARPGPGWPAAEPGTPVLARSVQLEDDGVRILDRRNFPFERTWVHARTVEEVAAAIGEGVPRAWGAHVAALAGMVLAGREAARMAPDPARTHLDLAARRLAGAGETTLRTAVEAVRSSVDAATGAAGRPPGGQELLHAVLAGADAGERRYRARSRAVADATVRLLPRDADVLTHGWADLLLIEVIAAARRAGKRLRFVCTETRPGLLGARLTAETLAEMEIDTTLVTDGTGASVLASGQVAALVTGAERVAMDGAVVGVVGTLGLAVAAHAFGVPYHVMVHAPDRHLATGAYVQVPHGPGDEVLHTRGHRTASGLVRGLYPVLDVTPPRFVATVVTDRGAFSPAGLTGYAAR